MIYSFAGWVFETILCSITERGFVNRGFLNGPVCPIYGTGALVVILLLQNQADNLLTLYLSAMVLTGIVEYTVSWGLEKFFQAKLWDYTQRRFNLNGRICLDGLMLFGLFSVLIIRVFHPMVLGALDTLSATMTYVLAGVIFAVLAVDTVLTVRHILTLNGRLAEIQGAIDQYMDESRRYVEEQMQELRDKVADATDIQALLRQFHIKTPELPALEELKEKMQEWSADWKARMEHFDTSSFFTGRIRDLLNINNFQDRRLFKAFPKFRSTAYQEALEKLRSQLEISSKSRKNKKKDSKSDEFKVDGE